MKAQTLGGVEKRYGITPDDVRRAVEERERKILAGSKNLNGRL
jgi:hypothetical protein